MATRCMQPCTLKGCLKLSKILHICDFVFPSFFWVKKNPISFDGNLSWLLCKLLSHASILISTHKAWPHVYRRFIWTHWWATNINHHSVFQQALCAALTDFTCWHEKLSLL